MKMLLALSVSAAVLCACADTGDTRYAQNDCKVAPVVTTTDSSLRKDQQITDLDRRYAEMQLATSNYRLRQLQRNPGYSQNNIEQSLADCASK
jgi:hypothetical protein